MSEYVPVIVPCSCPEQTDSKGRVTKPVPISVLEPTVPVMVKGAVMIVAGSSGKVICARI